MNEEDEKNQALSVLGNNLIELSKTYKECFLAKGKGSMVVYATDIINSRMPKMIDYNPKKETYDFFDDEESQNKWHEMIDMYNPRKEGILLLITSFSNRSYFITVKLK